MPEKKQKSFSEKTKCTNDNVQLRKAQHKTCQTKCYKQSHAYIHIQGSADSIAQLVRLVGILVDDLFTFIIIFISKHNFLTVNFGK